MLKCAIAEIVIETHLNSSKNKNIHYSRANFKTSNFETSIDSLVITIDKRKTFILSFSGGKNFKRRNCNTALCLAVQNGSFERQHTHTQKTFFRSLTGRSTFFQIYLGTKED